jgi:hypothetical protein
MGKSVPCVLDGDNRGFAGFYRALFSSNPPLEKDMGRMEPPDE